MGRSRGSYLEDLIYKWDAYIQDTLAQRSDTVACGYQLGRALAECYWQTKEAPLTRKQEKELTRLVQNRSITPVTPD